VEEWKPLPHTHVRHCRELAQYPRGDAAAEALDQVPGVPLHLRLDEVKRRRVVHGVHEVVGRRRRPQGAGPGRHGFPHHWMPFTARDEGPTCVSTT